MTLEEWVKLGWQSASDWCECPVWGGGRVRIERAGPDFFLIKNEIEAFSATGYGLLHNFKGHWEVQASPTARQVDVATEMPRFGPVVCLKCHQTIVEPLQEGARVHYYGREDRRLDFWLHQTCASALATELGRETSGE